VWAKRVSIAGLVVYAVLSVTDFVQTYALIESTGGVVYEANPVAAGWLDQYGWTGLAVYKAAAVLLVVGTIGLLVRRRPPAAVALTVAACLAVGFVTLRSHHYVTAAELEHLGDDPSLVEWKPRLVRTPDRPFVPASAGAPFSDA
jgi:hypothetical protein